MHFDKLRTLIFVICPFLTHLFHIALHMTCQKYRLISMNLKIVGFFWGKTKNTVAYICRNRIQRPMINMLLILTLCCSSVGAVEELSDGQQIDQEITRVRSFCLLLPFKICITKRLDIYTIRK